MGRDEGLATALFALAIGVVIAAGFASEITAPLCDAAKIRSIAPDKIEFGCLEFWLNRYQSLIGSIITAAVAAATLYWLAGQLRVASRQAAAQLAERAEVMAKELEAEREAVVEISTVLQLSEQLYELYGNDDLEIAIARWTGLRVPQREVLTRIASALLSAQIRRSDSSIETEARNRLIERLHALDKASKDLTTAMFSDSPVWDFEDGEPMTAEEIAVADQQYGDTVRDLYAAHRCFAEKHEIAVAVAWSSRAKFAKTAFAD